MSVDVLASMPDALKQRIEAGAANPAAPRPAAVVTPMGTDPLADQLPGERFGLNDQQRAIAEAVVGRGDDTVVKALAGTGKTSTLVALARRLQISRPDDRILYIAFNKSVEVEAKARMPRNVEARTGHSLAWARVGRDFWGKTPHGKKRLADEDSDLAQKAKYLRARPAAVGKALGILRHAAELVIAAAGLYANSADDELGLEHVETVCRGEDLSEGQKEHLLRVTREYWDDIATPLSDDGKRRFQLTLDHLRKLWALSGPDFTAAGSGARSAAQILFLDEAQDTPPVLARVIDQQIGMQQIVVGDGNQAIYCQPLGTKVTVAMKIEDATPGYRKCAVEECPTNRGYVETGLCFRHHHQYKADVDLPTKPSKKGANWVRRETDIEDLKVGDRVVTYDSKGSHLHLTGRPITAIARRAYRDELVRITTARGMSSAYTLQHQVMVRMGDELREKHLVYLMRRGDEYRVGRVPFYYHNQSGMFGLSARSGQEGADASWILSVHDRAADAAKAEALIWARFSLPGIRFKGSATDVLDVEKFWSELGPNEWNGKNCLDFYGRLPEFPLWTKGSPIGPKSLFVTAAANVVDGFTVFPLDRAKKHKGKESYVGTKDSWEPISVKRESYDGDIVSLTVESHHNYFADGLLTHNSFSGAVDYLAELRIDTELALTTSYRFGAGIEKVANLFLDALGSTETITGHAPKDVVGRVREPDAVLTRTNAGMLDEIVAEADNGRRVGLLTTSRQDLDGLVQTTAYLRDGANKPRVWHPVLSRYDSWGEVESEAEQSTASTELQVAVRIVRQWPLRRLKAIVAESVEVTDPARAICDVVVVTAHKAKGLEWDSVRIGDDFYGPHRPPPKASGTEYDDPEHLRLDYVAVTRARQALDLGSLRWILSYRAGEKAA